jgi:aspartyl-tRNA(Asn)/glutamyl-tRNA(Gln) amidotransferase subunit B
LSYEIVIGMEVHVELQTQSKMFCRCPADHFLVAANTHVCPVCTAQPGALPVINERAMQLTAMTGIALGCQVQPHNVFSRKNYVYPDLPKGYQVSQYELPLCTDGYVEIDTENGPKKIGVERVHLEEDTGKLVHEKRASLVDYNRAGVPLMEIVTDASIRSAEEAYNLPD